MDRRLFILGALESAAFAKSSQAQSVVDKHSAVLSQNDVKAGPITMHANFTRIFVDETGASKFEDQSVELKQGFAVPPADPLHIAPYMAVTSSYWVGAPTTWRGSAFHPSPRRQIFITLQGEYQVSLLDGTSRNFPAGSVLLLEDTKGSGHSSKITSNKDVIIFAVALQE